MEQGKELGVMAWGYHQIRGFDIFTQDGIQHHLVVGGGAGQNRNSFGLGTLSYVAAGTFDHASTCLLPEAVASQGTNPILFSSVRGKDVLLAASLGSVSCLNRYDSLLSMYSKCHY